MFHIVPRNETICMKYQNLFSGQKKKKKKKETYHQFVVYWISQETG